jgi:4-hydroxy-4-methyl-2-oxoglutarate aldolase
MASPTVAVHAFERLDPALAAAIGAATTPDVANVLGVSCVADPAIRPIWRGGRLLGSALTVKLPPGDNLGAVIAAVHGKPGDVMVVETGGGTTAIVGSLLSRSGSAHGITGFVVDGAARDIAELEAMRMPVWSRHVCPRQSTKVQDAAIGVPITCGGCTVHPGDLVLADDDGVVFASAARIRDALAAIAEVIANEDRLRDPSALEQAIGRVVAATRIESR